MILITILLRISWAISAIIMLVPAQSILKTYKKNTIIKLEIIANALFKIKMMHNQFKK